MKIRQLKSLGIMLAFAAGSIYSTTVLAKQVVFYASTSEQAIDAVVTGFEEKYPDIKVHVVRAGSGSLMKRLEAEKKNPQADIVWAGTPGTLKVFGDLFQPYRPEAAEHYPEGALPANHLYVPVDLNVQVFMVNKEVLNEADIPRSWNDLLNDKWKGKVIMGNPAQSSSSFAQAAGVLQNFGEEAFSKLASIASTVSTTSAVTTGVARGEFPISITLEYLAQDYVINGANHLEVIYPAEGSLATYFNAEIVKGAPNLDNAKKLIDYMSSIEGRERILVKSYRRPVREDVDVASLTPLPSAQNLKKLPYDEEKSSANYEEILNKWRKLNEGY